MITITVELTTESSDEEGAAIVIETDQSKPVSHTVADQSKLLN